jgi:rhodanese-related sulfurtransferase
MDPRAFKDALNEHFAAVAKALASPKRVELLDLLAQAERTVEWLAQATDMSVANTSRHLQVLRGARLVEARKSGLYVRYRLAGPEVAALLQDLRSVAAKRHAEVDRLVGEHLGDRGEPVGLDELVERVRAGDVTVIDVRPTEEYAAAHVPGARSVPLADLEALAASLPRDRRVVAYCRGPYCVFADQAVQTLRALGYDARRLAVGLPEWAAAGLPVERAA